MNRTAAGFFSVTNYDAQQHYKDRGPTWIKLYNRLLDDYHFAMLPDACKWHMIGIFLLASRHNNRIPSDPAWLARQIGAVSPINLALMERAGFIAAIDEALPPFCADVDAALDLFGNRASPEKKREEKNREETLLSAGADPSSFFEGFLEESRKQPYPPDFENFWKAYPTDPLMSKKKAFEIWRRMSAADRVAAQSAIPAFREYVKRQVNYRVVHAQRYLSERRYEGFAGKPASDETAIAAARDRADRLLKRGRYAETFS
jgi:hypothetical protein